MTIGGCDLPDRAQLFAELERLFEEAQERGSGTNRFVIRFNRHYTPTFIGGTGFVLPTFTEGYGPEAVVEMVNALYRGLFGLDGEQDQLAFVASWVPDELVGAQVVELQQRHRGLDVEAGKLLLVLDENNDIIQLVNRTIPDLETYAPTPTGEQNEIYYPADDACDRVMLAFRSSEAVAGGDEVTFRRASDGNIVSKVFVETNRTPGVMPPVLVGLSATERVYPLAGLPGSLPPLADHRRVSLFPSSVLFSGDAQQKVAHMADADTGLRDDIEALAGEYSSIAPQLIDDVVYRCAATPTIARVFGASTAPFERPANGWDAAALPSKYAVVKVTIHGFDPLRPPILEVLDAGANDALVERVWWRGTPTQAVPGDPQSYTIDLPVVIAGDPDPWDEPAKGGDPATRISRVRLLQCGHETDSVNIELIKSTRWPGNPEIGVHVVPAVWHDMRSVQSDPYVVNNVRPGVIADVYDLFFRAPRQDVEATSKAFSMQKLIGQARVQMRLLEIKFQSTGATVNPEACCDSYTCDGIGTYMSWGPDVGDPRGVDFYEGQTDVYKHNAVYDCELLSGIGSEGVGFTVKRWGAILLDLGATNKAALVAHELGHLILLHGHSADPNNLMASPTPGAVLPQTGVGIADGRAQLHCAVTTGGCALLDPERATPNNRYLQLNTQPAAASQ